MPALRTRYWTLIQEVAGRYALDPLVVEAVIVKESSGNTDAFRFEPAFWNRYLKKLAQYGGANPRRVSSSYGLMQIMYPVAIERGLNPTLAPEMLFVPELGVEFGCKQLAYLQAWSKGLAVPPEKQQLAMLAAYNGGKGGNGYATDGQGREIPLRTGAYARAVLAILAQLTTERS